MPNDSPTSRPALPLSLAAIAVLLGMGAMGLWMSVGGPRFGLRGAIMGGQLLLPVPALLMMAALRIPVRRSLGLFSISAREALLSALTGVALWSAGLGLMQIQSAIWPPTAEFLELFQRLHRALRPKGPLDEVLSVLTIALAPGLCEELLFRGVVLPSLRVRLGTTAAVAGSALLFGAIHLDPTPGGAVWFRVPFAVLIGLGLALLRLRTGSLLPAMLAHAVLNTITFEAVRFVAEPEASSDPEPVLGLAMLFAGALGCTLTLRALRPAPEGDRRV